MSLCLAILLGAPVPPPGPPRPIPMKAPRVGTSLDTAFQNGLKEMAGAVVVVEDTYLSPVPKAEAAMTLQAFKGHLRLLGPGVGLDTRLLPTWMNPNVISGGGQRLHTSYPLGWGY